MQGVQPVFELHDLRPCGPYTAAARWSMTFAVVPDNLPRPWTPKLTLTGKRVAFWLIGLVMFCTWLEAVYVFVRMRMCVCICLIQYL
jgi:hypothetical protein